MGVARETIVNAQYACEARACVINSYYWRMRRIIILKKLMVIQTARHRNLQASLKQQYLLTSDQ
jgi:hypothetical protein